MVIQCIADTHGALVELDKNADVIILLGDNSGNLFWKIKDFLLTNKQFKNKIYAILGNHDDTEYKLHYPWVRWMKYGEVINVGKYSAMFLPFTENEISLNNKPYADIVISHVPVYGLLEETDDFHQGNTEYLNYLKDKGPLLWIHGHVHYEKSYDYKNTKIESIYMTKSISFKN